MNDQPKQLGKYRITGVLGRGAMGIVYKAFDPDIKRVIALKTIDRAFGNSDASTQVFASRFRTEAEAAGRLTHPNIVQIYDYGVDNAITYIAMEFVEGTSLREYLSTAVEFPEQDAVSLMSQLLDALTHAHINGVWHRDIKPANLLIAADGRLKVADFGISRHPDSEQTRIGFVMGTPGYMAPERYAGEPTDHRGDVFAAGVIFYQLLAGEMPFESEAEIARYRIGDLQLCLPSQRKNTRGWRHYDPVVKTALDRHASNRFQTAAAFRQAMLDAYARPVAAGIARETIIRAPAPGASNFGADSNSARGIGILSTARPTGWDENVLTEVEKTLTRFVGPVAKVLVRRTARNCSVLAQLLEKLAGQLQDPDRTAFLKATAHLGTAGPNRVGELGADSGKPYTEVNRAGLVPLSPEITERAVRLLTQHVGPIARVLVKRAAAESTVVATFADKLSKHITEPKQRDRFMRDFTTGIEKR